jgi:hypothetical protein
VVGLSQVGAILTGTSESGWVVRGEVVVAVVERYEALRSVAHEDRNAIKTKEIPKRVGVRS